MGANMKVFLRFLVTIIVLVAIGLGVWALFFRKSDSESVFNALVAYEEFEEETNLFEKVKYIDPVKSAPVGTDLSKYDFLEEEDFAKIKTLILGNDETSGDDFYGYIGTAESNGKTQYYSIYSSQQFIISNFTKYTQFGGDVSSSSAKSVTNAIDSLKGSVNETVSHISELVTLQNKIVENNTSNFEANKTVLLGYYKTLNTDIVDVITAQYELANSIKSFVVQNVMNNEMDNDTKTVLVDCILKANEQVKNASIYEDIVSYVTDSSKIYKLAKDKIDNNLLMDSSAQEFVSAYNYLLENDVNSLNSIFKIKNEKSDVASLTDATSGAELLTKHQIAQSSFSYVKTILTYLGF